ncbi:MAG: ComEC/Rec2 family competence protein, partial [Ghiorsea sp.]
MPLLLPALGWLLGLVLARLDAVSLTFFLVFLLFNLVLLFFWRKSWLIACFLGLMYGLSSVVWDIQHIQADPSWLNNKLQINATIAHIRPNKSNIRLRLTNISRADGRSLAGKVDVYLYGNRQHFQTGMRVAALVKLHLPHNKQNPAFFDYKAYCFNQHITAIGSAYGKVKLLDTHTSWLEQARNHIRQALAPL